MGDVFAEFGAAEVVDVEGGDDGVEDDLTARAMQLSLETAAQENEERDIALAIQRSKEDCVPGSGTGVATSASSSSVDQLESEPRSREGRTGRPLRRWDDNVDISVFDKSKPLRRRDAMIGMDDLLVLPQLETRMPTATIDNYAAMFTMPPCCNYCGWTEHRRIVPTQNHIGATTGQDW